MKEYNICVKKKEPGGIKFLFGKNGLKKQMRSINYKTVKRNSTPELVMKQILKSIESGQLKPGHKLPTEHRLSEMFGVGRSTIREATSTLSMLGYGLENDKVRAGVQRLLGLQSEDGLWLMNHQLTLGTLMTIKSFHQPLRFFSYHGH